MVLVRRFTGRRRRAACQDRTTTSQPRGRVGDDAGRNLAPALSRWAGDLESLEPRMLLSSSFVDLGKVSPTDVFNDDRFGSSLAASGALIVAGSPLDDDAGSSSGSAYVFARVGDSLAQLAKLVASDAAAGDQFATRVAIDGDTIVVGSPSDDDAGTSSGSAYVFVYDGSAWVQQAKLVAPDAEAFDQFGSAVAVSGDRVVVTAIQDGDRGSNSGSAYVFNRDDNGTAGDLTDDVWSLQAKLTASDGSANLRFGDAAAIDGDTIVIGEPRDGGSNLIGAAYVFAYTGGAWSQQAKLRPDDSAPGDAFGSAVAVDAGTIVAGTNQMKPVPAAAYVFVLDTAGNWIQEARLAASDGRYGDGFSLSLDVAGDTLIVGAPGQTNSAGVATGAAYLYQRDAGQWQQQMKLEPSVGAAGDRYGAAVAATDQLVMVAAPMFDQPTNNAGDICGFGSESTPPPPTTPTTPDLADGSDTGLLNDDNVTANNTPTFSGTADPGATVELFDGQTSLGSVVAGDSGAWSITATELADGEHAITAVASTAGGESDPSAALAVTVDTQPPQIVAAELGDDGSSIVLHVDGSVAAALAVDAGNYHLLAANGDANGDDNAFNDGDEGDVAIASIDYDADAGLIVVHTAAALGHDQYRIEVDGDGADDDGAPGVSDLAGNFVNGDGFAAEFDRSLSALVRQLVVKVLDLHLPPRKEAKLLRPLFKIDRCHAHKPGRYERCVRQHVRHFIKRVNKFQHRRILSKDLAADLRTDARQILSIVPR